MPQNTNPPKNLQGGPSFTYGERGTRKRPADIDEIIHFVRTQGIARETTEMRLTRKAPLPGIGQPSCLAHQELDYESGDFNEHLYRNSPSIINNNPNSSSLDTDGTDEAYEFHLNLNMDHHQHGHGLRNLSPSTIHQSNSTFLINSHNNALTKSLDASQFSGVVRTPLKPLGQQQQQQQQGSPRQHQYNKLKDHSPTRNPRAVRNLPPVLKHEKPLGCGRLNESATKISIPARPTAPSPSVTPPLSSSDVVEEEEEEEFENEGQDYIEQ